MSGQHPLRSWAFLVGTVLMSAGLAAPALASAALADTADAAPTEGDLGSVVVIGDVTSMLKIPGSGAVISTDDLTTARVFTVNEALRQVPGVFARDEEGLGIRPNIGIRGLTPIRSTKVLLLEDGIPLGYAPYGDNAAYYHPPVDRFSRIEVLKGASQIRFGPQTIGGVINYITPAAPSEPTARLGLAGGNRGYLELDAQGGAPALGGRVLLHINRKQSDGSRDNQDLELLDIYAKGEWDLSETQKITLRLSRFAEDSQVTYSGLTRAEFAANPRQNPFVNDEFKTKRWSATLTHGITFADVLTLKTTAYYHYFDRDWWRQSSNSGQRPNDSSDPACGGMANLLTTCGNEGRLRTYDTYGVEARLTWDHSASPLPGSTEFGVRLHREEQVRLQVNGDAPTSRTPGTGRNAGLRENNERETWAYSGFIQSEFTLGPIGIKPGVRFEQVDYKRINNPLPVIVGGVPTATLTARTEGKTDLSKVIPGLGLTYSLGDQAVIYAGVHRGFAPPRVEDIITTAGGSLDLGAELSWNYELGVRGQLMPGLQADVTAFQMDFSNQIVPASVAGGVGATLTSAGKTKHRGLELSGRYSSKDAGVTSDMDIFARTAITWVEKASYVGTRIATAPCFDGATTGTRVAVRGGTLPCGIASSISGNRLPYSPEWLASAAVGATVGWVTGQVEWQHQSAMFADDVNLIPVTPDGQRGRIASWSVVNLSLSVSPTDTPWTLYVTAKNLFDKLYIADRARGALPGTPFLIQGGVTARF
jgi:Fe(3+) dicitrate transport protein